MVKKFRRSDLDNEISKDYFDCLKDGKKYLAPIYDSEQRNYLIGNSEITYGNSHDKALKELNDKFKNSRSIEHSMFDLSANRIQKFKYKNLENQYLKAKDNLIDFIQSVLFVSGEDDNKKIK